jgi:hypothetical protein
LFESIGKKGMKNLDLITCSAGRLIPKKPNKSAKHRALRALDSF